MAQPPPELPCNPYLDTIRFSARLECIVAVNRSVGGDFNDFQIRWFAQLGDDSIPQEILLDTSLGVRIDQPPAETTDFYLYQSQVRIADVNVTFLDRFWCQISASDTIKQLANITNLERNSVG